MRTFKLSQAFNAITFVSIVLILATVSVTVARNHAVGRNLDERFLLRDLEGYTFRMHTALQQFLLTGSDSARDEFLACNAEVDNFIRPETFRDHRVRDLATRFLEQNRDVRDSFGTMLASRPERSGAPMLGGAAGQETSEALRLVAKSVAVNVQAHDLMRANDAALTRIRVRYNTLAIASVAVLALFLLLNSVALHRMIRRPMEELMHGLGLVAAGELEHRLPRGRVHEFGRVADTFNSMVDRLRASRRKLESEVAVRRRAEEEVLLREREYRTLAENSPDIIIRLDRDLRFLYLNPRCESLLGLSPSLLRGRPLQESGLPAGLLRQLDEVFSLVLASGRDTVLETEHAAPDGARYFQVRVVPEFSEAGEVQTALAIGRDVTSLKDLSDLRRLESELRKAKNAAEEANSAKSEHLAFMSHEIRTPLNGIIGMIELALMPSPDSDRNRYLDLARQSARQLLDIINDILDLSRIESGRLDLDHLPFDLRGMIDSTLKTLGFTAEEKGLRLRYGVDSSVPAAVVGDEGRLRQVLVNIVGNAIKYTEAGEILVEVRAEPVQPDGQARLLFSVADTGPGIPRESLSSIFEAFRQAGPGAGLRGTGLGLAISKRLVETMRGGIQAESEVGKGSTFSFSAILDLSANAQPTDGAPARDSGSAEAAPGLRPLKILLAEDNSINRIMATELLEKRGHTVKTAENGREALDLLAGEAFDIVLLDVRMPVMSGDEVARIIRSSPPAGVRSSIPIIALTAAAFADEREQIMAAGVDDFISKPIDIDALEDVMRRVLAKA